MRATPLLLCRLERSAKDGDLGPELRGFTREAVVLAVTDLEWLAGRRAPLGGRGGGFLGMLLRVDAVGLLRGRLFRLRGLHGFFHTGSVSHSRGGVKNFFRSAKHVKAVTMSGRS